MKPWEQNYGKGQAQPVSKKPWEQNYAPQEQSLLKRVGKRVRKELSAIPDAIAGSVELPLQLATGTLAVPLGYVAGTVANAMGKDGKAVKDATIDKFTYKPRTVSARRSSEVLGKLATPIIAIGEAAGEFQEGLGGRPGLINDATKDVAMVLAGGAAARAAPKVAKSAVATKEAAVSAGRTAYNTIKNKSAEGGGVLRTVEGALPEPSYQIGSAIPHIMVEPVSGAVNLGVGLARQKFRAANKSRSTIAEQEPTVATTISKAATPKSISRILTKEQVAVIRAEQEAARVAQRARMAEERGARSTFYDTAETQAAMDAPANLAREQRRPATRKSSTRSRR